MNTKFMNSRRLSASAISNSDSSSSKQVKLRTILKGRGSQQSLIDDEIKQQSQSRISYHANQQNKQRLSSSLNLNQHVSSSRQSFHNQSQSESRNTITKVENCEQQLLGKQDFDFQYKQLYNKLEDLEHEAEILIRKKIKKISKKSELITLKDKGKDETTYQIEGLVKKIQWIKFDELQKFNKNQEKVRDLMDWKIKILEKLIAENQTQSEVLKKYFFAISAMNSKERNQYKVKSGLKNTTKGQKFFLAPLQSRGERAKTQAKETLCKQSSNKVSYHPPKLQDYQTYRYKNKQYQANMQPLPRSSYNSEYLVYNQKMKSPPCKTLDNYTSFGKSRLKSSTYSKDYQILKAELVNYKELDSYRNKFKNLQVSFVHQNNQKQIDMREMERSRSYIAEQPRLHAINKAAAAPSKPSSGGEQSHKVTMKTEAKREFKGQQKQIFNGIKNRRLNNLKYTYKTLVNQ